MGGFGSGRPVQHVTCEAGLKIDLADPAIRSVLDPSRGNRGSWAWSSHGEEIAAIGYTWLGPSARLMLSYNRNGVPVEQRILLTRTTPHFGGERWWFRCPFTGKRVRALYLPPGAREWGSRHAYKLTYQSQRESGQGRAMIGLLMRGGWRGDPATAQALMRDPDPFGFKEEASWRRRDKARERRNEIRRIARRERLQA